MTKWRSFLPYSKPVFASVLRCIHIKKYYSWEYSENSEMLKNAVLFALYISIGILLKLFIWSVDFLWFLYPIACSVGILLLKRQNKYKKSC